MMENIAEVMVDCGFEGQKYRDLFDDLDIDDPEDAVADWMPLDAAASLKARCPAGGRLDITVRTSAHPGLRFALRSLFRWLRVWEPCESPVLLPLAADRRQGK